MVQQQQKRMLQHCRSMFRFMNLFFVSCRNETNNQMPFKKLNQHKPSNSMTMDIADFAIKFIYFLKRGENNNEC